MASISGISAILQVGLLLVGFFWSVSVSRKISTQNSKKPQRLNLPVVTFNLLFTLAMLWLLVG
jgi:hypothetical protein